jgi:hypothetical protein
MLALRRATGKSAEQQRFSERPRPVKGLREHEWDRERIHLELEELTENVRRALEESQALLREVEQALNRR